jgi:predicted RNA binding protein YcfA (HicA-like mRNA interferase family)
VALKLKYVLVEGRKHTRVYDHEGRFVTTLPRGKIKPGTLAAILKQMGISKKQLEKML